MELIKNGMTVEEIFNEVVHPEAVRYELHDDGIHKFYGKIMRSSGFRGANRRMIFMDSNSKYHYSIFYSDGCVDMSGHHLWLKKENDEEAMKIFLQFYEDKKADYENSVERMTTTINFIKMASFKEN